MNFATPLFLTLVVCITLTLGFLTYCCFQHARRWDVDTGAEFLCGTGACIFAVACIISAIAAVQIVASVLAS